MVAKRRFCVNGHDTAIVGRYQRGGCVSCISERQMNWRKEHPDEYRIRVTIDSAARTARKNQIKQQMFATQLGSCLFCGLSLPEDLEQVALDHDHSCHPGTRGCFKCFRGLLHKGCNMAVGLAEQSPRSLRTAIEFLKGLLIEDV